MVVQMPGEVAAETVRAISSDLVSPRAAVVVTVDNSLHHHTDPRLLRLKRTYKVSEVSK